MAAQERHQSVQAERGVEAGFRARGLEFRVQGYPSTLKLNTGIVLCRRSAGWKLRCSASWRRGPLMRPPGLLQHGTRCGFEPGITSGLSGWA